MHIFIAAQVALRHLVFLQYPVNVGCPRYQLEMFFEARRDPALWADCWERLSPWTAGAIGPEIPVNVSSINVIDGCMKSHGNTGTKCIGHGILDGDTFDNA